MATQHVRALDANGDDQFGRGLASFKFGSDATAQRVRCNLLVLLGEWYLDASDGVPWWQQEGSDTKGILGSMPADPAYAESVLKARILSTDGIASIKTFDLAVVSGTRAVTVNVTGTDVDGATFSVIVSSP